MRWAPGGYTGLTAPSACGRRRRRRHRRFGRRRAPRAPCTAAAGATAAGRPSLASSRPSTAAPPRPLPPRGAHEAAASGTSNCCAEPRRGRWPSLRRPAAVLHAVLRSRHRWHRSARAIATAAYDQATTTATARAASQRPTDHRAADRRRAVWTLPFAPRCTRGAIDGARRMQRPRARHSPPARRPRHQRRPTAPPPTPPVARQTTLLPPPPADAPSGYARRVRTAPGVRVQAVVEFRWNNGRGDAALATAPPPTRPTRPHAAVAGALARHARRAAVSGRAQRVRGAPCGLSPSSIALGSLDVPRSRPGAPNDTYASLLPLDKAAAFLPISMGALTRASPVIRVRKSAGTR